MAPYYRIVTSTSALPLDQALLERMEKENKDELDKIEERLEEAKKTEGETDIADALRARANYLTRIGDKVRLTRVACCLFAIVHTGTFVCHRIKLWKHRNLRSRKLQDSARE